ncbi:hypothetical protein J4Q44_G00051430 [Coregonus suidteri]|uniref:Sm domain-containing protein n=1 Tax=Coregonus suidteri TaxID=861788 RepID=A0AAN8NEH7_9TELE
MTDGRTLVGLFLCTDRDCNVILGSAQEFLKSSDSFSQGEPRVLGLAMIPGHHVVSIEVESDSLADTQGFGGPATEEQDQLAQSWRRLASILASQEEATGEPTAPSAPESWTTVGESRKCSIKRKQMSPVSPLIRMEATEESPPWGGIVSVVLQAGSLRRKARETRAAQRRLCFPCQAGALPTAAVSHPAVFQHPH